MSDNQNWLLESPKWTTKHCSVLKIIRKCDKMKVNLTEVMQKSKEFPIKFPIETIRNKTLIKTVKKSVLERNVQSVYPIIHEAALYLCAEFLLLKQKHGSKIEKKFYKGMSVLDVIQRLLTKRAMVFIGKEDFYMLRDGTTGLNNKWELIGTDKQKIPLILDDYLSYDELKLSAFLSVSSYSYFINDGSRRNNGIPDKNRDNIESEGIIIGLIGTRLPRPNVMEHQDIVLSNIQNTDCSAPTIKNLFYKFYQDSSVSVNPSEHVERKGIINEPDENRYRHLRRGLIFDNEVYAKRLSVSFDTLLLEANHRAQEKGKFAYVHVVGIGLGVWRISPHQEEIFLHTFEKRIRALGANLNFVSDVDFSYFTYVDHGDLFPKLIAVHGDSQRGIKIHISNRQPFSKLENDDKLLVVSYAWDANAHPGNEFWDGAITHSSDSATAASCQVSELHNAGINPAVCAGNLMLATPRGVISAQDYLKKVLEQIDDGQDVDVDEEDDEEENEEETTKSWFSCVIS